MGDSIRNWWQAVIDWATSPAVSWIDLIISGAILAVAIAVAALFSMVVFPRLLWVLIRKGPNFDVKTVASVRLPLAAFIVLSGLYLVLGALSPPPAVQVVMNKASAVVAVVIGAVLINGVISAGLLWLQVYLHRSGPEPHQASSWLFPMIRRGVLIFIISAAAMVSLDILGINITPLVAGLGIAGLAVALALQPTLGNLFAGTYVVSEGVVTNYNKPEEPVNMIVPCGVAYHSDLPWVEAVSLEVANALRQELPEAEAEFEPRFFYQAFGDSNIDFVVVVQARNPLAGLTVRSELIKRLHSRYATEGITINYPVRTLNFPEGFMAQDTAQLPGGSGDEAQ